MKKKTNNEPSKKSLWCAIILWIIVIACWIVYFCISSNTLNSNNETEMIIDENTQELISEENDTLADIWETGLTEEETVIEEEQVAADPDAVVENWDTVVVDYVGKLTDWTVFDTSIRSVAEEAGMFNPQRDYESWLEFVVWAGNMIKGFEEAVMWMKVWETKSAKMPPEKAYWERSEENIIRVAKDQMGDTSGAEVWMQVLLWGYYPATITEITDTEIVFDTNHELAGKTLVFDITIKSIKKAK